MVEIWARLAESVVDRTTGPLHLRLFLLPTIAVLVAAFNGVNDAKIGRLPYVSSLLTRRGERERILREGLKSISGVFLIALTLDLIYQLVVQRFISIGEAAIVAFCLAIIPYVVFRGIFTRVCRTIVWPRRVIGRRRFPVAALW